MKGNGISMDQEKNTNNNLGTLLEMMQRYGTIDR